MATARGAVAAAFAVMLVAHEAAGGVGRPGPAFSAHYLEAMRQAEEQASYALVRRGIVLD